MFSHQLMRLERLPKVAGYQRGRRRERRGPSALLVPCKRSALRQRVLPLGLGPLVQAASTRGPLLVLLVRLVRLVLLPGAGKPLALLGPLLGPLLVASRAALLLVASTLALLVRRRRWAEA